MARVNQAGAGVIDEVEFIRPLEFQPIGIARIHPDEVEAPKKGRQPQHRLIIQMRVTPASTAAHPAARAAMG